MPKHWQTYLALALSVLFALIGFSLLGMTGGEQQTGSAVHGLGPKTIGGVIPVFFFSLMMLVDAIMIEMEDRRAGE